MMIFLFNIVLPISNSNISIPNHFNWKESDPDFKANTEIIERYDIRNSFNFSNGGAVSCYDTKMTTFSSCLFINNFYMDINQLYMVVRYAWIIQLSHLVLPI